MIITNSIAENNLSEYFIKNNKINRDIRNNKLFKIIIRLYLNGSNIPGYLVAGIIYAPTDISR